MSDISRFVRFVG